MKQGIKLTPVRRDELNEYHPLYALNLKIEDLDHTNMDRIYQFFEDMILPPGFYACVIRDEFGWWINFYKPVFI